MLPNYTTQYYPLISAKTVKNWFRKRRGTPEERDRPSVTADHRPLVLPSSPTDEEIRGTVAKWIKLMSDGCYFEAVHAVFQNPPAPAEFREQVENFFVNLDGARQKLVDRLRSQDLKVNHPPPVESPQRAKVIPAPIDLLTAMEIHRDNLPSGAVAWLGFHIPLDNGQGIWTTMGVLRAGDRCVLEFEIFHL